MFCKNCVSHLFNKVLLVGSSEMLDEALVHIFTHFAVQVFVRSLRNKVVKEMNKLMELWEGKFLVWKEGDHEL